MGRGAAPMTAPDHALRTGGRWTVWVERGLFLKLPVVRWFPPILHPLPDITVNVVQAERIGLQLARRMRPTSGVPTKPARPHQVFVLVADPVLCRRTSAAGKLPFRLRGQAVASPVQRRDGLTGPEVERFQFLLFAQLGAEFDRIIPAHRFHRVLGRLQPGDSFFVNARWGELGGIHAHHFFILRLRDFIYAQINRLRQDHLVLRSFRLDALLPLLVVRGNLESLFNLLLGATHRELAGRDEAELHAEGVGVLDRHAEVLGPRHLMLLGLLGIKRRDGGRRCLGGPTVPALVLLR